MTVSQSTATIVNTDDMDWISGPDLLASMDPAFVANLGPKDEVADAFDHYLVKPLLREDGGRQMSLAQFTPGYRDVTACFHESSEEGFVIDGSFDLAFEGHFAPEHYFWRPPGWVHGTISTDRGATALFAFESTSEIEQSGPVTRAVVDYDRAGENPLLDDTDPRRIGPRGYVPNAAGGFLARIPGEVWVQDAETSAALDARHLTARALSANVFTGGGTFLVDLAAGYRQPASTTMSSTYHFFVVSGDIQLGAETHPAGTWVYVPAGVALDALSSAEGATLYTKADTAFRVA